MKAALPIMTFLWRHVGIVVIGMVAGCVLWTLAYFGLLLVALVTGDGLGGPLAYPVGIAALIVAGVVLGWGIIAPASAMGAIFCVAFGLPRLAAIPVVFGSAFLFSYLIYAFFVDRMTTHPMPAAGIVLKNFIIYLSLPLGLYWWFTSPSSRRMIKGSGIRKRLW